MLQDLRTSGLETDLRFKPARRACEASILSGRIVPENSRSSYSWRVSDLGRVISLMKARPLDCHSRPVVDSKGLSTMCHLKIDFPFTQIVLYKLCCGSKPYRTVVGFTKMIILYALKLLVEAY